MQTKLIQYLNKILNFNRMKPNIELWYKIDIH